MTLHDAGEDLEFRVIAILDELADIEGPLLPVLNRMQEEFGYIPESVMPTIAARLNLTRAEVHGVVSFYHDYRRSPAGRHVLKLCRAEACQSMGADRTSQRLLDALGIDWHGTTPDGAVTVEPVYCLGLCACSPSAMLDGEVIGRLDDARIDGLVEEVRR